MKKSIFPIIIGLTVISFLTFVGVQFYKEGLKAKEGNTKYRVELSKTKAIYNPTGVPSNKMD